jgi:hypothetical protein
MAPAISASALKKFSLIHINAGSAWQFNIPGIRLKELAL